MLYRQASGTNSALEGVRGALRDAGRECAQGVRRDGGPVSLADRNGSAPADHSSYWNTSARGTPNARAILNAASSDGE